MSKRRKSRTMEAANAARKASRDAQIASGIRPRAVTFPNNRAVQNRMACRGKVTDR